VEQFARSGLYAQSERYAQSDVYAPPEESEWYALREPYVAADD
jgi:hypothetical protein